MAANWKPGNTRKAVSDEERRVAAYKDWLQGASGPMLVEKYGYSDRHAAIRAVRLVQRSLMEDADEARAQATERLMGPLMAMRDQAMPGKMRHPETGEEIDRPGDPAAAGQYKGLEERLAKLWGLDQPVRTEVTGKDGAALTLTFSQGLNPQPFQDAELEVDPE